MKRGSVIVGIVVFLCMGVAMIWNAQSEEKGTRRLSSNFYTSVTYFISVGNVREGVFVQNLQD